MRDNEWLKDKFESMYFAYFSDIPRNNKIIVRFKGKWKNKFGHIKLLKNKNTEICVNGFFSNEIVPEHIITTVLAHEFTHYAHGFNSPLQKKYKHPHAGGIVSRELKARGLAQFLKMEKLWIKNEWRAMQKTEFKQRSFF